jgi:uncharacterized protein (DUF58 family)
MTLRAMLRRQRITRGGVAYVLAVSLVASAAFISANNLLFLILAAMLATLLLSGFIGRLGLAELELDLLLPPHASARRPLRAAVRVKNAKSWIPSFSITLTGSREPDGPLRPLIYFPLIPGGASIEESVELYFPRRGAHQQRDFQFATRFPFGFVERREDVTIRHEVIVYPCLDPKPELEAIFAAATADIVAWQRGQGTDLYGIRPYNIGESARHIDWKTTARSGATQVRDFARELDRTVVLCLDLNAPAGDWLETAIESVAFLAWDLVQCGNRVRIITQGYDVTIPEAEDIYSILRYLALVSSLPGRHFQVVPDDQQFFLIFTHNPVPKEWSSHENVRVFLSDVACDAGILGASVPLRTH